MLVEASVRINRRDFDAVIFDLDGVLTDTAGVHAAAWETVFDAFLQRRADQVEPFSRLISIPTTSRMSMGVRAMTAFGVFSPREGYNFRKDRTMMVRTRRRSARSVIASRNCFDNS